jgi:hypothetical protein
MRRNEGRYLVAAILFVMVILCGNSSLATEDFSELSPKIMETLDSIKSYDMTVSYSERIKGAKALVFRMKSDCSSFLTFKSPDLLYIKATGKTTQGTGSKKTVQNLSIYTTFDGKYQKIRSIMVTGGRSTTNSIVLDTATNTPEHPYDGWNLRGFGLTQGRDYIGTVRDMLPPYDFVFVGRKQDVAEFEGTFNTDKCAAILAKTMTPERAKSFAQLTARMVKGLRIRVDTKRSLVVGYTQVDTLAERTCSFENIRIDKGIKDEVFAFHSLPGEQFRDITEFVRKSRERSKKLLAPNNRVEVTK